MFLRFWRKCARDVAQVLRQDRSGTCLKPRTTGRLRLEALEERICPSSGLGGSGLDRLLAGAITPPSTPPSVNYGRLPLSFEANQGQTDPQVQFLAHGDGSTLFLSPGEAVLRLHQPLPAPASGAAASSAPPDAVLHMQLLGANSAAPAMGLDQLSGKSNYLTGNNSRQWHTAIPNYGRVNYHDVYPGIDLVYYGNQQQLEYDFVVAPGASPETITLSFQGALQHHLDGQGNLVLHTAAGDVVEQAPVVYQMIDGSRKIIPGSYFFQGDQQVGFQVGSYDRSRPLVIDPVMVYSVSLSGSKFDSANGIAIDAVGNAYVVGTTESSDFPTKAAPDSPTGNPFQSVNHSTAFFPDNVFVTKLSPTGAVVYSTYLGGSQHDEGTAIAVDAAGNAFVAGLTSSPDFPEVNPLQTGFGGGTADGGDAFVAELDPTGSTLSYATFLGGAADDGASAIALDGVGNIYVTGSTNSVDFPATTNAYQTSLHGSVLPNSQDHNRNVFVAKIDPSQVGAKALLYATYLGGQGSDDAFGLAVDGRGAVYVTGHTLSSDFPTAHAWQDTNHGNENGVPDDAFVAKIDPSLAGQASLVYSTYLGGGSSDIGQAIAVDGAGNASVTGETSSTDFPLTVNAFQTSGPTGIKGGGTNVSDAFVSKFDNTGTLVYSTYLGGSNADRGEGIAVDGSGDIYLTGNTRSSDFPTTPDALEPTSTRANAFDKSDAYVTVLNPTRAGAAALVYSSYLGGPAADAGLGLVDGHGIAVDTDGRFVYVTGSIGNDTVASSFDGFVNRIQLPGHALSVIGTAVRATSGRTFAGQVATFTESDPSLAPGNFTAAIDWGDGQPPDQGTIQQPGGAGTPFQVLGSHTYANSGAYAITVRVHDSANNIDVSANDISRQAGGQQEGTIAVDPTNPARLFAASNTDNPPNGGLFAAYSTDGGLTWTPRVLANGHDGLSVVAGADPVATFDSYGNLFLAFVDQSGTNAVVLLSVDGGKSFSLLKEYNVSTGVAQPKIAVGPGDAGKGGSLWVLIAGTDGKGQAETFVAGTAVLGLGNVAPLPSSPQQLADATGGNLGDIAVGPMGQVLVDYQLDETFTINNVPTLVHEVVFHLDPDGLGPKPFDTLTRVFDTNVSQSYQIPALGTPIDAQPKFAWDRSGGPHNGRVYVCYVDAPSAGSSATNIFTRFSDDNGTSWSEPVQVNDDLAGTDSHFLPAIALDQQTGNVVVTWYDTRNDLNGLKAEVFAALSSDSGLTWSSSTQISPGLSSKDHGPIPPGKRDVDYGAYSSVAFAGGVFHPALVDNSSQLYGNPALPQYDLATAAVGVASVPRPSLKVFPAPVTAMKGRPFAGVVATFTETADSPSPSDFTAKINWGDGTTSAADSITQPGGPGATFQVSASHTYVQNGAYPVVVTVSDTVAKVDGSTNSNISQAPGNQSEGTIAVDPTNPSHLFAASNDEAGVAAQAADNSKGGLFAAYSLDGGVTWNPSDPIDHLIADGDDDLPPGFADPKAVFDQFGNLFLTYVASDQANIVVALSTDGGKTFTLAASLSPSGGTAGSVKVDQPSIAAGPGNTPGAGSVWVTFADIANHQIVADGAPVTGKGAVGLFNATLEAVPGSAKGNFGSIDIGPTGQVAVNWQDNASFVDGSTGISVGPDHILVSVDPDGLGNAGFGPPIVATTTNVGFEPLTPVPVRNTDARGTLAWDRGPGPHSGRLYLSYVDASQPANTNTFINLRFSDDNGQTWSPPVRVDDATGNVTRFQPRLAVDQDTGDVAVTWYDTRNDANNTKTQVFAAVSGDGGQKFSASVPISLGASDATDPKLNRYGNRNEYGDYTGLVFLRGVLAPVWSDNSKELEPQNPDRPQFDLANARVAVAHVAEPRPIVTGLPLNSTESHVFSGPVATFTDPDPNLTPDQFSASIDWGDGSSTPGIVSQPAGSSTFDVSGDHVYRKAGAYPVVVTVHDAKDNVDATSAVNVSQATGNQTEPSIAVDPTNPSHVFAASIDESGVEANPAGGGLFAASSTDSGATWKTHNLANGNDGLPPAGGAPQVAFDQFGNLFLLYVDATGANVVLALSTDGGDSFSLLSTFAAGGDLSRPALATGPGSGPGTGSVWVAFVDQVETIEVTGAAVTALGALSTFSHADPIPGQLDPLFHVPDPAQGELGSLAIGPSGQVAISYFSLTVLGTPATIFVNVDGDGLGAGGFGPQVAVTSTNVGRQVAIPAQANRGIQAQAGLAWDRSTGPNRGRLYLVYTDSQAPGNDNTHIFVRYSADAGADWSQPLQLDDDKTGASHFLPSIAVDQTTGYVAVGWYDTRNDPSAVKTQFFAALSGTGGKSFTPNVPLEVGASDATDPKLDDFGKALQYGDYSGLAFQGGMLYPAWADNSLEIGATPDLPQFDVAAAAVGVAQVGDLPLTGKALDITPSEAEATEDVATFTDLDPNPTAADFTALIDWGDKTPPSSGTIMPNGQGGFTVSGDHAYLEEGSYTLTVSIKDNGGAATQVSNMVDVDDADLQATGLTFKPVAAVSSRRVVATFTDGDPNGTVGDYSASINWGDGTTSPGIVRFSGSAGLAFYPGAPLLYAIGKNDKDNGIPYLFSIDSKGKIQPLFKLGSNFKGGLAVQGSGTSTEFFAIANDTNAVSTLYHADLNGLVTPLFGLGSGFTGGLAFNSDDQHFYAIATDDSGVATLYRIDLTGMVQSLFSLGTATYGGLTYRPTDQALYAGALDSLGMSTLVRIDLKGMVVPQFVIGPGFAGGLAFDRFDGNFYGVAGSSTGSSTLFQISPKGPVAPVFEIGAQFSDGFSVTGTKTYPLEGSLPVSVAIKDSGGSANTGASTAVVVDAPPQDLLPLSLAGFQGITTGLVTVANFTVPGGIDLGPNEFSATIDWADGSPSDPGTVTVLGTTISVAGRHTYSVAGLVHPLVTLTDHTGNTAAASAVLDLATDVSNQVKVVGLGPIFNPKTLIYDAKINVTNITAMDIPGPIIDIVFTGLAQGVTLVNATGETGAGDPFLSEKVLQLAAGLSLPQIDAEFNLPPVSYTVKTFRDPPAGFGSDAGGGQADPEAALAAQGSGTIEVRNSPIHATEGAPFSGLVASFTDTDTDLPGDFSATIAWGDGATSSGTITGDGTGSFNVSGSHTYQDEGFYEARISIHDHDGTTASATSTVVNTDNAGFVTYHVSIDTSELQGQTGALSFQFNPGATPAALPAEVTLTNFVTTGGTVQSGLVTDGDATGTLGGGLHLKNSGTLNLLTQDFTFGTSLSFDLRLSGPALANPSDGLFGSTFAVQLLGSDKLTPKLSTDPSGSVLTVDVLPNGPTMATAFSHGPGQGTAVATAAAGNIAIVFDAPLQATQVPLQAVQGVTFTGVVATGTDGNPSGAAEDLTAQITWGDGTPTSAGIIAATSAGSFTVTGTHIYAGVGEFPVKVTISDRGGSQTNATAAGHAGVFHAGLPMIARGSPTALAAADFNHDGKPDLVVVDSSPSSTGVAVYLGKGDGTFADPVTYTADKQPNAVVVGDFTGDGKLDLVVNNIGSNTLSFLKGNGDGTFQPPKNFSFPGYSPWSLAVGDFDKDGKLDLAVSAGPVPFVAGGTVTILLGNGDGTFRQGASYETDDSATIIPSDLTGDGNLDLVVKTDKSVSTLLGNGDGTFNPKSKINVTGFLAVGDFNGDGKPDLAVSDTHSLSILAGNGDGSFGTAVHYPFAGLGTLTVGDFNRDGKPDLLAINFGAQDPTAPVGGLSILLNKGDGTFAPPVRYSVVANPASVALADFNGDGNLDVAVSELPIEAGVSGVGLVHIILGSGDGTLVAPLASPGGGAPRALALADLNGDGKLDLVTTNLPLGGTDNVSVQLGNGDGTFGPPVKVVDGAAPRSLTGITLGDLRHNGKIDLIVPGLADNQLSVFLGNGDGTFGKPTNYDIPLRQGYYPSTDHTPTAVALGDVYGDGNLDLIAVVGGSSCILRGKGDGTFGPPQFFTEPFPAELDTVSLGDLKGDGKLDIVGVGGQGPAAGDPSSVNVFLNKGDGTFAPAVNYKTGKNPVATALADLRGNGKLDLITANQGDASSGSGSIDVFFGVGDGTFLAPVEYPMPGNATPFNSFTSIQAVDVNGDGKPDLVVVARAGNTFTIGFGGLGGISVLLNNGDGTFGPMQTYSNGSSELFGLAVADVNGDGLPDLITANGYTNTVSVILNSRTAAGATVADAPIVAAGVNLNPRAGQAFTASVASFTTTNVLAQAGDFAATIAWGDGGTSPGTVTADGRGGFAVAGTHIYTQVGLSTIQVTITDRNGGKTSATGSARVSNVDSPLSAVASALQPIEGIEFTNVVATFTDADPQGTIGDFSAAIDWGDGRTVAGTITANSGGFDVTGTHTYTKSGIEAVQVDVLDIGGAGTTASSTTMVAPAIGTHAGLTANAGPDQTVAEGAAVTFNGTFIDPGNPGTHTFLWNVNATNGQVIASGAIPDFTFTPTDEGAYTVSFTVTNAAGASDTSTATVTVTDLPPVLKISGPATADPRSPYTLDLSATIAGADAISRWTITWGDGTVETFDGNPSFVTHTYPLFFTNYTISATATNGDGTFAGDNTIAVNDELGTAAVGQAPPRLIANFVSKLELISSNRMGDASHYLVAQSYFVDQLYADVLGRSPDLPGLNGWVEQLQAGVSRLQVASAIWESAEHRGLQVDAFYRTFLHRVADPAGRTAWVNAELAGASETDVALMFVTSAEYQATHSDDAAYVKAVYEDVLGRAADPAGLAFWQAMLQGGTSRPSVALALLSSTEALRKTLDACYVDFLRRPADAPGEQAWLALLGSHQASPALVGDQILASGEYFSQAIRGQ